MIVPAQAVRVVIATRPIDFRRGHDSLAAYVQNELKLDPHSGALIVFRSRRAQLSTFCIRFSRGEDRLSLAPAVRADGAGVAVPARQGSDVHLHGRAA
jgi:transposase